MTAGSRSGFGGRSVSGGRAAPGDMGIGQVLAKLRAEFPDISPSKIRFLEAEGLILPQRAESGYRRFAVADIERLRYILTAQRDEYLPLRVIKERLAALDGGGWPGGVPRAASGSTLIDGPLGSGRSGGASVPGNGTPGSVGTVGTGAGGTGAGGTGSGGTGAGSATGPAPVVMTRSELLEAAGADEALLTELEDYGLVRRARQYSAEALQVARGAVALREYGIQPRHLRAVKAAAEREISLVEQVVAPLARQKASREPAQRAGRAVAALIASLHATLVEEGLNDAGLASAPPVAGTYQVTTQQAPGLRSASGR
ncbi:MAG: transcriptional regulator, MerR family [Actinomycetia bacterium]|nr:transcriptional regulator, MerR family [Actinomycetes bacterium]